MLRTRPVLQRQSHIYYRRLKLKVHKIIYYDMPTAIYVAPTFRSIQIFDFVFTKPFVKINSYSYHITILVILCQLL